MKSDVTVHENVGGAKVLRRDAAENRQRVLDAAAAVFSERGLDVGVDEIARAAGVGTGTLYRRFPTKDALISELVRQLLADLVALADSALSATGSNKSCTEPAQSRHPTAGVCRGCGTTTRPQS
jgi:AcrR family transcriptional regulator